jgi:RND family efflux transporter MFP subunit
MTASPGSLTLKGEYVGTLAPHESVYVFSAVAGAVDSIGVEPGIAVKEGDTLFTIKNDAQVLSLEKANVAYQQTYANMQQAIFQIRMESDTASASYEQLESMQDQAITNAENALNTAITSYQLLLATKNQDLGAAAQISLLEIQSQIDSVNANIEKTEASLYQYEYAYNSANSALNDANAAISAYSSAAAKLASAQSLAAEYAALQATEAAFLGVTLSEAAAMLPGVDGASPTQENINAAINIQTRVTSAGLPGVTEADISLLQSNVNALAPAYNTAAASLSKLEASRDTAQAQLNSAQITTSATVNGLYDNLYTLQRMYELASKDAMEEAEAVYNAQLEKAQLAIDQAEAGLQLVKENYQTQLDKAVISVNAAEEGLSLVEGVYQTQLDNASIGIASAQLVLDQYHIEAPIDGTVDSVNVTVNNMISSSSIACTISDHSQMELTFNVSEKVKEELSYGQSISFEYGGTVFTGSISEISNSLDAKTTLFKVKALVDTQAVSLPTGISVCVSLDTFSISDGIVIPYNAVHFSSDGAYVYTVRDSCAVKVNVETGLFDTDSIYIVTGLAEGDVVITSWSQQLRNGAPVKDNRPAEDTE